LVQYIRIITGATCQQGQSPTILKIITAWVGALQPDNSI